MLFPGATNFDNWYIAIRVKARVFTNQSLNLKSKIGNLKSEIPQFLNLKSKPVAHLSEKGYKIHDGSKIFLT